MYIFAEDELPSFLFRSISSHWTMSEKSVEDIAEALKGVNFGEGKASHNYLTW